MLDGYIWGPLTNDANSAQENPLEPRERLSALENCDIVESNILNIHFKPANRYRYTEVDSSLIHEIYTTLNFLEGPSFWISAEDSPPNGAFDLPPDITWPGDVIRILLRSPNRTDDTQIDVHFLRSPSTGQLLVLPLRSQHDLHGCSAADITQQTQMAEGLLNSLPSY